MQRPVRSLNTSKISPESKAKCYTLVLDLDETLVHYKENKYLSDDQKLKIRPGV